MDLHWLKPVMPLKLVIGPAEPPDTFSADQFQVPVIVIVSPSKPSYFMMHLPVHDPTPQLTATR